MMPQHHDDAVNAALDIVRAWIEQNPKAERVLLVDDLIGRLNLVVWPGRTARSDASLKRLQKAMGGLGKFFSGMIQTAQAGEAPWEALWTEASPDQLAEADGLRILVRVGDHLHWFGRPEAPRPRGGRSRVVTFLSFKGGVGRTTALASFALQRARAGEHVVVVDLDLDAPGVGTLLAGDPPVTHAPFGVVDFMLDVHWADDLDIHDYLHRCARPPLTDRGRLQVMPAGTLDARYLSKLARADLDASLDSSIPHRLKLLLDHLEALQPDWILLDARAGLSTTGGLLLNGLADLYVLVATAGAQSFFGLERFVHQLGARRRQATPPEVQSECVVVHTMIPGNAEVAERAQARFESEVEDIFRAHYYDRETDPEDGWWSVADMESDSAPHRPVDLGYQDGLAFFRSIDQVADLLATHPQYVALGDRILERMPLPSLESDDDAIHD